ncbi:MAG: hypothetical protein SGJ10_04540 [Bacteroidota bacterium]|nr:hypothetical protein [Bacteroidota bacterium]
MFKKASYLRSPLFYVAFILIFFALTEAIILFFDKQNFEALKRVFSIVGLLVLIIFDFWLREVKLSRNTKMFVQIIIAVPLALKFLYPYSKDFYDKIILDKTFYESNIKINNTKSKQDYIIFVWNTKDGKNIPAKDESIRAAKIDFSFDTANILMFKDGFDPAYFEKLKYSYIIKDSTSLSGEIETNKNPELITSPYFNLATKTKYNYHVFKIVYDSNNEPYLLQAINFNSDRPTMQRAVDQMAKDLQKN